MFNVKQIYKKRSITGNNIFTDRKRKSGYLTNEEYQYYNNTPSQFKNVAKEGIAWQTEGLHCGEE